MTPEQAVDYLVRTGVDRNDRIRLRRLFKQVATTAKADETRRCAAMATENYFEFLAADILRTGGLEVET